MPEPEIPSAELCSSGSLPTVPLGSKPSKAERPTSAKTKPVVVPRIPQEILDEILGRLGTDSKSLRFCSLVSKSWVPSRHVRDDMTGLLKGSPNKIVKTIEPVVMFS